MSISTPLFVISDEMELLALWRLVAEAKFAMEPDDRDLWGSPLVSVLSKRLGDALREAARRSSRPGELARVESWAASLRTNVVLPIVQRRLQEDAGSESWARLTHAEKGNYVRDCVAPFCPDAELVEELIRGAEA